MLLVHGGDKENNLVLRSFGCTQQVGRANHFGDRGFFGNARAKTLACARMPIAVYNRQRRVPIALPWLRRFAGEALAPAFAVDSGSEADLPAEVEVSIVSDRTIARVHRDFMGLPEPTDVITFHHGEIVASAETARARAAELGHSVEEELALYIVHGLLHLNGFDDVSPGDAARMRKVQHRLWKACLAQLPAPA